MLKSSPDPLSVLPLVVVCPYRAPTILAALRKRSGLSQIQLAQALSVGQSYVSKVERGEMYVDLLLFVDWCRACGAAPEHVVAKIP